MLLMHVTREKCECSFKNRAMTKKQSSEARAQKSFNTHESIHFSLFKRPRASVLRLAQTRALSLSPWIKALEVHAGVSACERHTQVCPIVYARKIKKMYMHNIICALSFSCPKRTTNRIAHEVRAGGWVWIIQRRIMQMRAAATVVYMCTTRQSLQHTLIINRQQIPASGRSKKRVEIFRSFRRTE